MNDLDAEVVGQMVKVLRLGVVSDLLPLRAAEFVFRERLLGDVQERVLGEMAD